MKKKLGISFVHIITAALLVLALSLPGCGGDTHADDPGQAGTSESASSGTAGQPVPGASPSEKAPSEENSTVENQVGSEAGIEEAPPTEPSSAGSENPNGSADDSDPTGSGDNLTLLTADEARSLICERINTDIYTVTLTSEQIETGNRDYYQFTVSSNDSPLTPSLIVDKESGRIYCYTDTGDVQNYSSFPLYNASTDAICDWNGDFVRLSEEPDSFASIRLGQADSNSFEFTLTAESDESTLELLGVARIRGNTAIYTEDGFQLDFLMNESSLVIAESGENPYDIYVSGTYLLSESADDSKGSVSSKESEASITREQAFDILASLSKEQTGLPADISEYTLIVQDGTVTIKGIPCYSVCVYANLEERLELMNTFSVSLDGKHIFTFDVLTAADVEIER